MKKIFIILFIIGLPLTNFAQNQITLEVGQTFSNFVFKDTYGKKDNDYKFMPSMRYSLGYRHLTTKSVVLQFRVGVRKSGANLNYDEQTIEWNLDYLDANIGFGYQLGKAKFRPYLLVSPYFSYLYNAHQYFYGENIDLKDKKQIQNTDYGINIQAGCNYLLSDKLNLFFETQYLIGFQNLEVSSNQKMFNRGLSLSLGVSISLSSTK